MYNELKMMQFNSFDCTPCGQMLPAVASSRIACTTGSTFILCCLYSGSTSLLASCKARTLSLAFSHYAESVKKTLWVCRGFLSVLFSLPESKMLPTMSQVKVANGGR